MKAISLLCFCLLTAWQVNLMGLHAAARPAQEQTPITVKGVVTDESGLPLIGVNIKNEESGTGCISDLDGAFSLSVHKGEVLTFSYIGYMTEKVVVEGEGPLNIVMKEDTHLLNEVVVVGYGTVKKSDLTGAVESLKPDDLNQGSTTNVLQMLQGQVPGLYINSHNQDPGATNTTLLRGVGSLSGSSEPLVVIDGLPISDMAILNTISSSDIQQIDVLKDASATAIYGSRGANGVIIITTKTGSTGKVTVEYGAKLSIETVARTVDMMDSEEYIRFYYDLAHDPDFSYGYPQGFEGNYYPYPLEAIGTVANTDWQKELTKGTPLTHEHNLSVSGGTDALKYRISANYFDGSSIVGPYNYKRYNFDTKITYNKGKWAFMASMSYTKEDTNRNKNSYQNALRFAPTCSVYDAETGELSEFPVSSMSWYENPFLNEYDTDNFSETSTTRLNGTLSYEFLPGLKLEGRAGFERRYYEEYYYQAVRYTRDNGRIDHSNNMNLNLDLLLTYAKDKGKHHVDAMGGVNYQTFRNRGNEMSGEGFSSSQIKYYQMNNILEKNNREISSFWNERALSSYMFRANYSFDDRYLLTANFRVDGATQFADNNKWGYFPSVALAWKINNEKFYHNDFFNNMKLKLGYGLAGNANIPAGRSQTLLEYVPVYTGGVTENGVTWSGGYYPNPDLKWEGVQTLNLGFELGCKYFWMEVNGYYKKSFDLLIDRSKPVESGYSKVTLNKGELRNLGVEARIDGYLNFLGNDLSWNPSLTVSYNHNEITEFDDDIVWTSEVWGVGDRGFMGYAGSNREGYPVGAIFGYEYLGVWQQGEEEEAARYGARPGEPKFLDWATSDDSGNLIANEPDGRIDDADRIYQGSSYPAVTASFNNTIRYKDWSLSIMIDGVFNKTAVNYNRFSLIDPVTVEYGNLSTEALERWTPDRPNTDIPSLSRPVDSKLAISTFCIEDASFVRLREVTLAWQHEFDGDFFLKKLRVYLTGSNLATITGYRGLNPDIWGVDNSWNLAPITRSYLLGFNLTF